MVPSTRAAPGRREVHACYRCVELWVSAGRKSAEFSFFFFFLTCYWVSHGNKLYGCFLAVSGAFWESCSQRNPFFKLIRSWPSWSSSGMLYNWVKPFFHYSLQPGRESIATYVWPQFRNSAVNGSPGYKVG